MNGKHQAAAMNGGLRIPEPRLLFFFFWFFYSLFHSYFFSTCSFCWYRYRIKVGHNHSCIHTYHGTYMIFLTYVILHW
ncbi:hypothetical protein GGS21DRAFT_469952 [Xylaria nigripes]|nr:hypothetical protein GGS21DRAFT_469952 [Xylaria nigripes]